MDVSRTAPPGVRRPALRTIINPVTREVATFTRYNAETDHRYFELDVTVHPGGGLPLHYHAENDEVFTATSAAGVHLRIGAAREGEFVLARGETATVPKGTLHRFWNPTDEDMTFTVRGDADSEGFEKGLYIWYGLARDGKVRADGIASNPLHVAVIMYMQDTWLPGRGFWLMSPIFALLYRMARWTGIETELVRRYWVDVDVSAECQDGEERVISGNLKKTT